MRNIAMVIFAASAVTACGGATVDERTHTVATAPIEVPDPIDRDIRAAGMMEGTGGERLAQIAFDGGAPIVPPSGFDAGGLPFGPNDAGVPPIGIPDSGMPQREAGAFVF